DNAIPLVDHCWSFGGGAEGYALLEGVATNPYGIQDSREESRHTIFHGRDQDTVRQEVVCNEIRHCFPRLLPVCKLSATIVTAKFM
ncbi:unnamed protein product, partial [Urochloa humidicola]